MASKLKFDTPEPSRPPVPPAGPPSPPISGLEPLGGNYNRDPSVPISADNTDYSNRKLKFDPPSEKDKSLARIREIADKLRGGEMLPPGPLDTITDAASLSTSRPISAAITAGVSGLTGSYPGSSYDERYKALIQYMNDRQARGDENTGPVAPLVRGIAGLPASMATGGGSAMGLESERRKFIDQVRKACRIAKHLRSEGARPYGVVRIDSAASPDEWYKDPEGNQQKIAETFRQACDVAESFGEKLAAEGEICWGGMHSWRRNVELLEMVNRPKTLGFQADMAHTLLFTMGYNAPGDRLLPEAFDWSDQEALDQALRKMTHELRPWTIDFHVAQNDATVKGSGSHDKTGRHCLPNDPNGKLDISRHAGYWLRDDNGNLTKAVQHVCWDGCMFPNATMMQAGTWRDVLKTMIAVRDAHGWD